MMNKDPCRTFLRILVFAAFPFLSACAGGKTLETENPVIEDPVTEKQEIHRLIVKSSQETVYNGKPQPISFHYTGEKEPGIIYYLSPEARKEGREGSSTAPVQAGTYYVRVIRYPGGNEHISVEEVFA